MMAENHRQVAVNMLSSIAVFVLNVCVSFFLTPFIVEKLGTAAYGFIGLSNNIISYSALLTVAVNSMAGRFITIKVHENDFDGANRYLSSVFITNIFLSAIIMAAFIVVAVFLPLMVNVPDNLVNDVRTLFIMLALSNCLGLITGIFSVSTFIRNRLDLSNIRNLIGTVIRVVLMLLLFGVFVPKLWYFGVASVVMGVYTIVTNYQFFRTLTPELRIRKSFFQVKTIIEVTVAGAWNIISRLSEVLSKGFDLLLANIFISAKAMGILSITQVIPMMILNFFGMLSGNFAPEFTRLYAIKDYDGLKAELLRSVRITGFFSCIPLCLLFAYGDIFYRLWLPMEDAEFLYYLSCIGCAAQIFALPLEPLWNIFTITNKVRSSSLNLFYNSIAVFATVILAMYIIDDDTMRLVALAGIRVLYGVIRVVAFLPVYGAKCLGFGRWTFYPLLFKNVANILMISIISIVLKECCLASDWTSLFVGGLFTTIAGLAMSSVLILNAADRKFVLTRIKSRLNIK